MVITVDTKESKLYIHCAAKTLTCRGLEVYLIIRLFYSAYKETIIFYTVYNWVFLIYFNKI
jgi:hypothetical protein